MTTSDTSVGDRTGPDAPATAGALPPRSTGATPRTAPTSESAAEQPAPGDAGHGETGHRAAGGGVADEYLDLTRWHVANYYVYDQRTIGAYVEGSVTGDVAQQMSKGQPETRRERSARQRRVSAVAIGRDDLDRLQRVVVEAGQPARARQLLESHRLLLLQGPTGVGKGTAALTLLGWDREILDLDPSLTAGDLADFRHRVGSEQDKGYLVQALSRTTASQLSEHVTRAVVRDLVESNSLLVMTLDDPLTVSPDAEPFVITWRERPEPLAVLRRHLAFQLDEAEVETLLARLDVTQLLTGLSARDLRSMEGVARDLARAFRDGSALETVVDSLGFGAHARVEEWFTHDRTPDELAFLIAVAVLGGRPFATVNVRARRLEALIVQASRMKRSRQRLDPRRSRTARIESSMAMLHTGTVETELGPCPAEIVQLQSPRLRLALFEVLWRDYDLLVDALLHWLGELGDDPDPWVRLHAAAAAGWLSQYDFAVVHERVLRPWAMGSSAASRAAADALGLAAGNETTASLALALLEAWAWSEDSYDFWWTAAAGYGGDAGYRFPNVAMTRLLEILDTDDARAMDAVVPNVVRLLTSGGRFDTVVATYVLDHLAQWPIRGLRARTAMHAVVVQVLRRAADPLWPSSSHYLRLVLDDRMRDRIAPLVREVLADHDARKRGLPALETIVRGSDGDDEATAALASMLTRAVTGPGAVESDRARLLHYLDRWANTREDSSAARQMAASLRKVIQA